MNQLIFKKSKFQDDFIVTGKVLGEGINGKVLACIHRATKEKFALKVKFVTRINLKQDLFNI